MHSILKLLDAFSGSTKPGTVSSPLLTRDSKREICECAKRMSWSKCYEQWEYFAPNVQPNIMKLHSYMCSPWLCNCYYWPRELVVFADLVGWPTCRFRLRTYAGRALNRQEHKHELMQWCPWSGKAATAHPVGYVRLPKEKQCYNKRCMEWLKCQ